MHRHPEPVGPGFWAVTRYADVWTVDRDFQAFSSEPTIRIEDPDPATLSAAAAAPEWLASNFISGPRTMPLRFRPRR